MNIFVNWKLDEWKIFDGKTKEQYAVAVATVGTRIPKSKKEKPKQFLNNEFQPKTSSDVPEHGVQ